MRIAVLRGGPSKHYETSLKTGEFVLSHLREEPEKYQPLDIFLSKDGEWHIGGVKREPYKALQHVDVVWNALHGESGEDGRVSRLLSNLHIPYTGSSTLGQAIALNRDLTKKAYSVSGMPTPRHEVLPGDASLDDLLKVFHAYLHPVMVKPVSGHGLIGVELAHSFEELKEVVANAFRHAERVMVEEFVRGIEVSCSVVEGLRGEKLYALIPAPNSFKPDVNKRIEHMSRKAHEALGLRHYSSSNFVVTPKGKIYIIDTNALPELTKEAALPKSLESVGMQVREFIEHIIALAHDKKEPVNG